MGWEIFYINHYTDFLPFFPIELEGFLLKNKELQITLFIAYIFGVAYAKEESSCNTKVTKLMAMWSINLIHLLY